MFDFKGQGMRTDVLLAKGGDLVNVSRHGEEGGDKGYDRAWAMCEINGKEGWMPRRYLTALERSTCNECKVKRKKKFFFVFVCFFFLVFFLF
jgi:hypothetical protein